MNTSRRREGIRSALEAARAAGISKNTLLRWLRQGKVPEVARDRNGWRIFSPRDVAAITAYARKTTPPGLGGPGSAACGELTDGRTGAGGPGAPDRGKDTPPGNRCPGEAA
jgi:hypothetical protein